MRKILLWIGFFVVGTQWFFGQVGINTIDPKAQLHIASSSASNPKITDGILIPRIERFPNTQPTIDQDGMLVYLKTNQGEFSTGFYYWNNSKKTWSSLTGNLETIFFKNGTVLPANNTTDGIFRTGNIGIGAESPGVRLKAVITPETDHSIRTGMEIDNSSSSPGNVTYGILVNNRSLTSSRKYGIKTNVSSAGKGVHYGIYNEVYQSSVEDMYGIFNKVGRTYGVSNNHYGIYSEIGTSLGSGMVYGIYSKAEGNTPGKVFAGYFAGRVGIGLTPSQEYVFPDTRGKNNQILVQNEYGALGWKSLNIQNYTSTSSSTGTYVISEETFTLAIQNGVSSITIPNASLNKGRIINLLAWNGIATKALNFLGGDDLWDITIGNSVSSISGGQRITIQSTGNRWVIINKD